MTGLELPSVSSTWAASCFWLEALVLSFSSADPYSRMWEFKRRSISHLSTKLCSNRTVEFVSGNWDRRYRAIHQI